MMMTGNSLLIESFKHAHYALLREAFISLVDIESAHSGILEPMLSEVQFMAWEQVQEAMTRGLTKDIIHMEFIRHSVVMENGQNALNLEGFASLLARLEHMDISTERQMAEGIPNGDKQRQTQPPPATTATNRISIPDDVKRVYKELRKPPRRLGIGVADFSRGVDLEAVLQWRQLRVALTRGYVSERVVMGIFYSVLESGDEPRPSNESNRLSLEEFFEFCRRVQQHIDVVCEGAGVEEREKGKDVAPSVDSRSETSGKNTSSYDLLSLSLKGFMHTLESLSSYVSVAELADADDDALPEVLQESVPSVSVQKEAESRPRDKPGVVTARTFLREQLVGMNDEISKYIFSRP